MRTYLLLSTIFPLLAIPQTAHQVTITPLDLEPKARGMLSVISQIETSGKNIYLRSNQDPAIVIVNLKGQLTGRLGGAGYDPHQFGEIGIAALAVEGDRLWAIDMDLRSLRLFENGIFQSHFPLPTFSAHYGGPSNNLFAFSDNKLVVPNHMDTKTLAAVYHTDGTFQRTIGEPLEFAGDHGHLDWGLNETFWFKFAKGWLSVHKNFPVVSLFQEDFTAGSQFQISSSIIEERLRALWERRERPAFPIPVFTDAKVIQNNLFLLCDGYLHKIDLKTQKLESITSFHREKRESEIGGSRLTLFFFTFLDDGTCLLAHPVRLVGHDLWVAKVPKNKIPENPYQGDPKDP